MIATPSVPTKIAESAYRLFCFLLLGMVRRHYSNSTGRQNESLPSTSTYRFEERRQVTSFGACSLPYKTALSEYDFWSCLSGLKMHVLRVFVSNVTIRESNNKGEKMKECRTEDTTANPSGRHYSERNRERKRERESF